MEQKYRDKETFEQKLVNELKAFQSAFASTLGYQKYEVNVFDCLHKRYIEAGCLINEYERRQALKGRSNQTCEMKPDDIWYQIEGCINDYDNGEYDKEEVITVIYHMVINLFARVSKGQRND